MIDPRLERAAGGLLSFDDVQELLVQAMLICWRFPDRERGWQRIRSAWPEIARIDEGDHDARGGHHTSDGVARGGHHATEGVVLRPAALTRAEVAEMDEAFGWLDQVPANDRKLIGLAITALARGEARVPWMRLRRPMGVTLGADGLRRRYGRALSALVQRVNRMR